MEVLEVVDLEVAKDLCCLQSARRARIDRSSDYEAEDGAWFSVAERLRGTITSCGGRINRLDVAPPFRSPLPGLGYPANLCAELFDQSPYMKSRS